MSDSEQLINQHREETEIRLDHLFEFINNVRATMKSKAEAEKAELDQIFKTAPVRTVKIAGLSEAQNQEESLHLSAMHFYADFANRFLNDIPQTFNYSCLILIYTLLEERGLLLCKDIRTKNPSLIFSVDELKGEKGEIHRVRLFLEKQCGLKMRHWDKIDSLRKIRNAIVHSNGIVKKTDEKLIKLVGTITGVTLTSEGRLCIADSYVDFCLKNVKETFDFVFKEMKYESTTKNFHWPDHLTLKVDSGTKKVTIG